MSSLSNRVSLSLKLLPVESVDSLCFAVPGCTKYVSFLEMYGRSKVNVVGNLKSLSETLNFYLSITELLKYVS